MMKYLLQFSACLAVGAFIALLALVGMMFTHSFGLIEGFLLTGKPLAALALSLLPEALWQGIAEDVRASFLQFCAALGQLALLLAAGLFRWCCWR